MVVSIQIQFILSRLLLLEFTSLNLILVEVPPLVICIGFVDQIFQLKIMNSKITLGTSPNAVAPFPSSITKDIRGNNVGSITDGHRMPFEGQITPLAAILLLNA